MGTRLTGDELEELVVAARSGSRRAFALLYDGLVPEVARVLATFAGPDRSLLDDLVQDVFVRVAQGLHHYRPRSGFRPWLITIALNVGRNHVRRAARELRSDDQPDAIDLRVPDADALVDVVDLASAVATLPPTQREVVALRVGADLDFDTVAGLLDIPVGTARRRMHDATQHLRRVLIPAEESNHGIR